MDLSNAIRDPSAKRLSAALVAALGLLGLQAHAQAAVLPVTSCGDDGSAGTLRQVAATAASGDQIDLSGLACSTITLSAGEIVVPVNATVTGPANGTLSIVATQGRVLNSTSTDPSAYLNIQNLSLSGGRVNVEAANVDGGCVRGSGTLRLTNSTVSNCAVSSGGTVRGGAIYAAAVELVSSRVSGSSVSTTGAFQVARGGGVYAYALSCVDSTLSGNTAAASGANYADGGGAAVSGGNVTLNRCTIDTNYAGSGGGIIQFARGADMTIENSTISGNIAQSAYGSGGVHVFCADCSNNTVHLLNSTIAFNSAPTNYGAGISSNGPIDAQSSIIASNVGAAGGFADLYALDLTGADNAVMSTNVVPAAGVITVTVDPQLQPLNQNGGATRTHAPSAGSPALQAGNNSGGFATDQRGLARVVNGAVDIGAFQTQLGETLRAANDAIFSATFN